MALALLTLLTPNAHAQPSQPTATIQFRPHTIQQSPPPATRLLEQISTAISAERTTEAQALAAELHERWPNHDEYTALWIDQITRAKNPPSHDDETLRTLWNLRKTQAKSAAIAFALGNYYAHQGRWNDAQSAFQSAYAFAPNHPDPAYNLGVCWEQLGQQILAQHYYRLALEHATTNQTAIVSSIPIFKIRERLAATMQPSPTGLLTP